MSLSQKNKKKIKKQKNKPIVVKHINIDIILYICVSVCALVLLLVFSVCWCLLSSLLCNYILALEKKSPPAQSNV